MSYLQSILGLFLFILVPFLLSKNKKKVSIKFIVIGLVSQFVFAFLLLKVSFISSVLLQLNALVSVLQASTNKASSFMFGYLAGGAAPFEVSAPQNSFIVAFQVLPLILVISALSALLFHFGLLGFVIDQISRLLRRSFKVSGPLGFGAASTIFLGTIEAPLIIRPYLAKLTKAELLSLIVCSMATIAGTVMVLYASVLELSLPNALTHLLTASIISIPAALLLAHTYMPIENETHNSKFQLQKSQKTWIEVLLDAIQEGVKMIVSIVAIIIVLFAFIHLIDSGLAVFSQSWSISAFLSQLLRPVMWLVGLNWEVSGAAADLMGTKIILNEFVSFLKLAEMTGFNDREKLVIVYSLCGFANFASCGIIIAGLTAIIPQRREEIVKTTLMALILGNIATLMTGAVINIISQI